MRIEFVVELDDGVFFFFTHLEAHDGHAEPRPRGRVDVLDAGDFPDQLFHRRGDALLHFLRGRAGHLHEDVHHGNDDLRLFLARRLEHGERAQQNRKHHDERRELGVDEVVGDAPGKAELARAHRPSTRAPSRKRSIWEMATFSPAARPERISTRFPKVFPVFTNRYSTVPSGATTKIPCNSPWSTTAELGTARLFGFADGKAGLAVFAGAAIAIVGKINLHQKRVAGHIRRRDDLRDAPFELARARSRRRRYRRRCAAGDTLPAGSLPGDSGPCLPRVSTGVPGMTTVPASTDFAVTMPSRGATSASS